MDIGISSGKCDKMLGVTLGWTTIIFRRESQCTKSLHGTEIGKSFGWIGLLAQKLSRALTF